MSFINSGLCGSANIRCLITIFIAAFLGVFSVGAEAQQDTVPVMPDLGPSPLLTLSASEVAILILSVNEHEYSSKEYAMYSLYAITHDVDGKFLVRATDEDVNDLLKEMSMTAAHKVEFRNAIASWRSDPQQAVRIMAATKRKIEQQEALEILAIADYYNQVCAICLLCVAIAALMIGGIVYLESRKEKKRRSSADYCENFVFFILFFLIIFLVLAFCIRVLFKIYYGAKYSFF